MAEASGTELRKAGGWVIVWGVSLIVAGIVAIVEPAVAAVATALLLAWLFVFSSSSSTRSSNARTTAWPGR
jgi:uncharacterized membrane protein HdeD (DUF308 family)